MYKCTKKKKKKKKDNVNLNNVSGKNNSRKL